MNSIVTQPQNVRANVGEVVTFTIDCGESEVLSYQWQYMTNVSTDTWNNIDGETSNIFTCVFSGFGQFAYWDRINETQVGSAYDNRFRCVVTYTDSTVQNSDIVRVIQNMDMAYYRDNGYREGMIGGFYFKETSDQLGEFDEEKQEANGQLLYDIMHGREGWKKLQTCAIIGNMWAECRLNPGMWQTWKYVPVYEFTVLGYGWVQWTGSSVLANECKQFFPGVPYRNNGLVQIEMLIIEANNPSVNPSGMHWGSFLGNDTMDLEELTKMFMIQYCATNDEESLSTRINYAYRALNHFATGIPVWMMKRLTKEGRFHI